VPWSIGKSFDRNISFFDDLFDTPYLSILQTDLDAMRVVRGLGENILHNAFGEFTCTLILFQDNKDSASGFDIGAGLSIHGVADVGVTVGGCGVFVIVGGGKVFVGMVGTGMSVGRSVGSGRGVKLGVRVGSGVGVGRLKVRKTRFSA
jgi:hypothetical protein